MIIKQLILLICVFLVPTSIYNYVILLSGWGLNTDDDGGGQKCQKNDFVICERPLINAYTAVVDSGVC